MWHISSMYVQQSFGCVAHVEQEGGRDMMHEEWARYQKRQDTKVEIEDRT